MSLHHPCLLPQHAHFSFFVVVISLCWIMFQKLLLPLVPGGDVFFQFVQRSCLWSVYSQESHTINIDKFKEPLGFVSIDIPFINPYLVCSTSSRFIHFCSSEQLSSWWTIKKVWTLNETFFPLSFADVFHMKSIIIN